MTDKANDPFLSSEWREYAQRAVDELLPRVKESASTVMLFGSGDPDPKQAIELGYILLLDKPLVLLIEPGSVIPERLRRAADETIEGSIQHPKTQTALREAINRVMTR